MIRPSCLGEIEWPQVGEFEVAIRDRNVCLGVPRARHHLAPAVPLQQPVDGRAGHLLAHPVPVGLLHSVTVRIPPLLARCTRSKQLLLLLRREVRWRLPPRPRTSKIASPSLAQRECMTCTVAVDQPNNCAISLAEPAQRRPDQHALNALVLD